MKSEKNISCIYKDRYRKLRSFSANSNCHIQHRTHFMVLNTCHSELQSEISVSLFFASIHNGTEQFTDVSCNVTYYCAVFTVNRIQGAAQYTYTFEYMTDYGSYHCTTRSHAISLTNLVLNIKCHQSDRPPWGILHIPRRQAKLIRFQT